MLRSREIWDRLGPAPASSEPERENLTWLRRLVLVHVAARTFLTMPTDFDGSLASLLRAATIAVALAGLAGPAALVATRVLCGLLVVEIATTLPFTANHVFLEFLCVGILALLNERDAGEGALSVRALRWIVAVFFLTTGLQKVLYGFWFRGEFLAYFAATEDRFGAFFGPLIPDAELARLRSYNGPPLEPGRYRTGLGAGPYRVDAPLFVLVSNLTWICEIVGGLLLFHPRTRAVAAWGCIGFVVLIELAARELTFGVLISALFLLFVPGRPLRRFFPFAAAFYAYLVLHRLGFVPFFDYSPA